MQVLGTYGSIYTVRTSGKEFVKVMNSHDLRRYDGYFSPDTIFIVNGKKLSILIFVKNCRKRILYKRGQFLYTNRCTI